MDETNQAPAYRNGRPIYPMPAQKKQLTLKLKLTLSEYDLIKNGSNPEGMDGKWFIYLENDWLYFHRSWTGLCVYTMRLAKEADGYQAAETWINNDPSEYQLFEEEYESALVKWLIDRFLLDKDTPIPRPKNPPWKA